MEKKEKQTKKGKLAVIILCIAAIVMTVVFVSGKNTLFQAGNKRIELEYGFSIQIPAKYAEMVEHTEDRFQNRITDVFVMKTAEADISLYSISFGDRESGDWLGQLNIDGIGVPVTYTMFQLDEESLEKLDEKGVEAYEALRESFSELLNTVTADPRMMKDEAPENVVLGQEVEMTYWKVILPEAVQFEETNRDGVYQADFYGEILENQVMLYSVRIGGDSLQTELGLFEVGGEKKTVSVESTTLSDQNNWTQKEYETVYRMMDTINDVINAIMSSKQFSATAE